MIETTHLQNNTVVNPVAAGGSVEVRLADLGCDLPATATVDVTIVTHAPGTKEIILERNYTWSVEAVNGAGELTAVYNDSNDPMDRPARVPDWVRAVCELAGVDEVAL